jgi:hypothetical protein
VLENSVVSHAKELNYLPRSSKSSRAIVRITFQENTNAQTILIPKSTPFVTTFGSTTFNFVTDKTYIARRTEGNTFVSEDINIVEGTLLTGFDREGFFGGNEDTFKCVLNNINVDTDSIEVFLDDETVQYTYAPDIFGVQPDDTVFYIEPYFDGKYAVVFGRNTFGRQPTENDDIKISYRICSEDAPNGASRFSTSFKPNIVVTTIQSALGGSKKETLESIKFFAPKSIQIQERAVTANDYKILLRQRFPEIEAISVYGADELDPPQFGKVAISVSLRNNATLTETTKNVFSRYISERSPLTVTPIFINPEFLYNSVEVTISFSSKLSRKTESQIESLVRQTIQKYSQDNLNDFSAVLRVSKLSALIDDIDEGILSTTIIAKPIIEYAPPFLKIENPAFNFEAALIKPYPYRPSNGFNDFKPAIRSSVFSFQGTCALLQDDGNGNIQIVSSDVINRTVIKPTAGTVDYSTGLVKLIGFSVENYASPAIKVFANTKDTDVRSPKSRISSIRDSDVVVKMIESRI